MKRWLMVITAGLVSVLGLATAQAGGQVNGVVSSVQVRDSDGLIVVFVNGTNTGRPACAASTTYWIIPNENSESGKKLYALLLAAKVSGISVQINGNGTCNRWVDGEDINYVFLNG